jgi:predicted nucleotidyltransferase
MDVDESLVHELVRRILTVSRPDKIILFGSAAAGRLTPDSDLDLLVLEAARADTRGRSVEIRRALRGVQYPIDVIVMSSDRFEETKDIVGGIAYPANKYGRTLYEAA